MWNPILKRTLVLVALPLVLAAVPARGADFIIQPGQDKNLVTFTSHATLETFQGKTKNVSGALSFDPASLGDSITVMVEVDLASLDTGIPMRNKHMRENHLETAKFPKAVFKGGHVLETSSPTLNPGSSMKLRLAGQFDLHGVTRAIEVPIEVTRDGDGTLHVDAKFDVALADYNIERPAFLMLKLEDVQHVSVQVTARPKP
jgi:polyisoprenoid-binding protein YceI